jgi:hypothetical protein
VKLELSPQYLLKNEEKEYLSMVTTVWSAVAYAGRYSDASYAEGSTCTGDA